jgi:UDP-N-acetylglucosamine:LPS N-acetylglucosamine transferase
MRKVLIVSSSGGHLDQALLVVDAFEGWEKIYATFEKEDAKSRLPADKLYGVYFPTNRNVANALRNLVLAIRIMIIEKPNLVFSTGAGVAVPFFIVARLFSIQTMYLECLDRIFFPTLTSKLLKPWTSHFICQSEAQMIDWPNRQVMGLSR